MKNETSENRLPTNFIDDIQNRINQIQQSKNPRYTEQGLYIDWSKIKENVEALKTKCARLNQKMKEENTPESQEECLRITLDIRDHWMEIRAMMDGKM